MANLALRPITSENWRDCIQLTVRDDQKGFVASNLYSLAEAAYEPTLRLKPFGVYDNDTMVGFVMYGHPTFEGKALWFIFRLMVDGEHQGRGCGRRTMEATIQLISAEPDCDEIYVSYRPDNSVAVQLYASLGFVDEGREVEGETLVRLALK